MKSFKIQISVPCYKGLINPKLKQLCRALTDPVYGGTYPGYEFTWSPYTTAYPEISRNGAVCESALVWPELPDVDAFLLSDADMEPDFQNVVELVTAFRNNKYDILGAVYRKNSPQVEYCVQVDKGPSEKSKLGGILPVYTMGFGFALVSRKVFSTMPKPWFNTYCQHITDKKGQLSAWRHVPEDESFCLKAREWGFKAYCDFDNEVKHDITPIKELMDRMRL